MYLWPYRAKIHNQLEQREIICSIVTLYTAVVFNSTGAAAWVTSLVIAGVVLMNASFWILYVFCFLWVPNFNKFPFWWWVYELWYLYFVKVVRWMTFNDNKVSLWLWDDPESTDYLSTIKTWLTISDHTWKLQKSVSWKGSFYQNLMKHSSRRTIFDEIVTSFRKNVIAEVDP